MSARTRKEIALWIILIFGTVLTGFQIYKYATNTLQYRYEELIILTIAIAMMIYPIFLLNIAKKIVDKN